MIWPFTTIAKLREELRVTQSDLRLAEGHLKALTNELSAVKERHTKALNLEQELVAALKEELGINKSARAKFESELYWLKREFTALQKALAQAQKNDVPKDIKTGKFTKKPKDV